MATFITALLTFAAENADVGGRGDNPSEGTGIVTIAVIAALVLAGGLALGFAFSRGRSRRRALERNPDTEGRVGRVSGIRRPS
jgi:hypothetical protein